MEKLKINMKNLFDWKKEMDSINMKDKMLMENCEEKRIRNDVKKMKKK